jgi:hypothetical protein
MANTQGIAYSFKSEALSGIHALGTTVARAGTGADTIYAALYATSANIGPSKTTYGGTVGSASDTGEVTGTGYTPGGVVVTNATAPTNASGTGYWTPSASITFTGVTFGPTDCVLLFNNSQGNRAIGTFTFSAQTVTAGTLTLTMPANAPATALLALA